MKLKSKKNIQNSKFINFFYAVKKNLSSIMTKLCKQTHKNEQKYNNEVNDYILYDLNIQNTKLQIKK